MKRWQSAGASMVVVSLMLGSGAVWAVVQQLREQGYTAFEVSRTLLGRVRVLAWTPDGERRELVFNPGTKVILRDYVTPDNSRASPSIPPVPRVLDRPEDDAAAAAAAASSNGGSATANEGSAAAVSAVDVDSAVGEASGASTVEGSATADEALGNTSTGHTNGNGTGSVGGTSNEADDGTGAE
jgi:hypothetical protein